MIKKGCITEIIVIVILSFILAYWHTKIDTLADVDSSYERVSEEYTRMGLSTTKVDSLLSQVREGDKRAYCIVRKQLSQDELFPYSFLMANKFNCKEASFDIFCTLSNIYGTYTLDSLDARTREIAMHHYSKVRNTIIHE